MRRLLFMIWKELLELRQDKRMLPIVFVAPILQLIVLGYAATTDVKNVPMVVADEDGSSASRDLVQTVRRVALLHRDVGGAERGRRRRLTSRAAAPGWRSRSRSATGSRSAPGRPTTVQLIADGTDANSTNIALGYASNLVAAYAQDLLARPAARRPRCRAGLTGATSGSGSIRSSRARTS